MSAFSSFWLDGGREVETQTRSREDGGGTVEFVAQRSDRLAAMSGTERMQFYAEFGVGDFDVGGAGQGGLNQGSALVVCAPVVGSD